MADGFLSALLTKYNRIVSNGVILPQRSALNVVGATATDDPANDATNLTIVGGSGSSGGATSVTFNFTQPAVNSTVNVSVGTTAGIQSGQSIAIGGGGYYINTSTVNATHLLLLNTGAAVNASPAATILSGDIVTVAGQGASLAAAAPLNGQALQLLSGSFTPQGIRTLVNVLQTGADPLGDLTGFNSQPAIMAAIAAAGSQTDVYIPAGYFWLFAPIVNDSGNCISIRGESGHTIINGNSGAQAFRTTLATYFIGDAIVVCPEPNGGGSTPVYTHYTAGGDDFYFLQLNESQRFPYINLSFSFCGDISGSTALRWEGMVDVPIGDGSVWGYVCSQGQRGTESPASALRFRLNQGGHNGSPIDMYVSITTTVSGTVTVSGGSLSSGAHKIATSYDGAFLRLWLDGVFVAHVACSGTVVQEPWETFLIGSETGPWPDGSSALGAGPYSIAAMLLATTKASDSTNKNGAAKFINEGTTYTPETSDAGLVLDAWTRWQQTFTPANTTAFAHGQFAIGQTNLTLISNPIPWPVYSHLRGSVLQSSSCEIRDLGISTHAGGIHTVLAPSGKIDGVNITSNLRCITLDNNCYNTNITNCRLNAGSIGSAHSWCHASINASANAVVRDIASTGGTYGYVAVGGGMSLLENIYHITNGLGAVYGNAVENGDLDTAAMHWVILSDESGNTTDATVFFSGFPQVEVAQSIIVSATNSGVPVAKFDACGAVTWNGSTWIGTGSQAFEVLSEALVQYPFVILNQQTAFQVVQDQPWTDSACPVSLRFPQTDRASITLNFAGDADMVFGAGTPATFNNMFWGELIFTDTGAHLTMGRNVKLSTVTAGYKGHVWNKTTKTLTIEGPSGSGFTLATNTQCDFKTDGTNVVQTSAAF